MNRAHRNSRPSNTTRTVSRNTFELNDSERSVESVEAFVLDTAGNCS